jgi:NADH:ubiquinone oxidoreductase subunit D
MVEDDRLTELMAQKDTVLKGIKDMEFDYQVGKLSEEDYERFNLRLRRQAIGLIQQIEKLAPETASLDEQLEMFIERKRKVKEAAALNGNGRAPVAVPAIPAGSVTSPARFCTECGQPAEAAHRFCASCGSPIAAPVSTA